MGKRFKKKWKILDFGSLSPCLVTQKTKEILLCKVEFIQPSNWFYSVPNLLVIQYLVTLYLGGFDVRVVSERE